MESNRPKEIIQYHPSQLKIEKRCGKKTATMFCATRKPSSASSRLSSTSEGAQKCHTSQTGGSIPGSDCTMSSINTDESDYSDNLSVVSDISDLSVLSFPTSLTLSLSNSRHHSSLIPGVHGQSGGASSSVAKSQLNGDRRMKHMAKKMALLQTEKDAFQKQVNQSSSHRLEVSQLKEENFRLRRENVNLKSQVESIQTYQKSLVSEGNKTTPIEETQQSAPDSKAEDEVKIYEFRSQLRKSHDQIDRLQTDNDKLKMELKSKSGEVENLRGQISKLSEESNTLKRENRSLRDQFTGLEANQSSLDHVNKSTESKLTLLDSDLKRAIESKDWYQKQLQVAQEQRTQAQNSLVGTQDELSSKNVQIVELRSQLDSLQTKYEKEQVKTQSVKDEFAMKLRKIEAEMSDQEIAIDKLIEEKDEVILNLNKKLDESKAMADFSGKLQDLESELESLKSSLEEKDREISLLTQTKEELEADNKKVRENFRSFQNQHQQSALDSEQKMSSIKSRLVEKEMIIEKYREELQKLSRMEEIQDEMEKTLQCAMDELEFKADNEMKLLNEQKELEKKIEELEQELLENHQNLDDSKAEVDQLKTKDLEHEAMVQRLVDESKIILEDRNRTKQANLQMQTELSQAHDQIDKLQQEITTLSTKLAEFHSQSPVPDLAQLKEENITLRQQVLHLEQFENQVTELDQEIDQVKQAKANLNEKLLESEKFYLDEIETLRQALDHRESLIDGMKSDIEAVEMDLCSTRIMLESTSEDKERTNSEQSKKLEELEYALEDYQATKQELTELQMNMSHLTEKYNTSVDENESLVNQFQNVLIRIEGLEHENSRLKNSLDECLTAEEEFKELHAQRIARLETFIKEYEREIEDLNESKGGLQNQIIALEDQNGKLVSESVVNESLREQVIQLQKDLKNDTKLRQELIRSIDIAKTNLEGEISSLENSLKNEKQNHAQTRATAINLEHETFELQQEVKNLQLKYEECLQDMESSTSQAKAKISTSESSKCDSPSSNFSMTLKDREIKELEHVLEEKTRSIVSLEDHISTLKFHLQQKSTELEDTKKVMALNSIKYDEHVAELKELLDSIKHEKATYLMTIESLSEEKSNYKSQVQDMNLALRNSLEHIKQLRSQTSHPSSPLSDESALSELFRYRTPPPPPPLSNSSSRNLSNLHSCLASLKAEMAVLQSKLAPTCSGSPIREISSNFGTGPHLSATPERIPT
ncbi:hypothetical protein TCAL_14254 [Tigriopus californicus]|uniref:Uncharacterized protein n=1 Tax=Tigriopus californicus TaxID=6832 RepID=A0A553NT39_TIGCA|nr:putative leucine-rich repeat-containing protein DDB_G0290503 [Tigriopus californicus]TRY68602.1 hypothetical protein TCAL_14254 [Tigriopus californicus]